MTSTFDIFTNAPELLRHEALNITLKFERTGPTTGRISWNIPAPAAGCKAGTQAYAGMVVTIDTTPSTVQKIPTDGTVYTGDPTADPDLNAGDRLGTSLVVGAFYNDLTTAMLDVTGLKENTPYYVTGFPVDNVYRYFIEGVHAYSLAFASGHAVEGTHGYQVIKLGANGVILSDATNLVPGITYDFKLQIDCDTHTISFDGNNALTYETLIAEINRQISLLGNPPQSPYAPNTGAYYWDATNQKLYMWDGTQNIEQEVIVQSTAPNTPAVGAYWLDPNTNVLLVWNGTAWVAPPEVIHYAVDPRTPACDNYWYNGSSAAYLWNGDAWCSTTLYNQETDPSIVPCPPCGSFWYNTVSYILYRWVDESKSWSQTTAIQYDQDPNALPTGTYWFNETTNVLSVYNTPNPGWNTVTTALTISDTAPTSPLPSQLWYKPDTEQLYERDAGNTTWTEVPVLVFPEDPTVRASCDLWWNTSADQLFVWDVVNAVWAPVSQFYQQATDPLDQVLPNDVLWLQPSTGIMSKWLGNAWEPVVYFTSTVDPITSLPVGATWHDTTNDIWYEWNGAAWVVFTPTVSVTDPYTPTIGDFWFDSGTNALFQWNGTTWVSLLYSTTPLAPAIGTLWYDTTADQVKEWNGSAWVATTPIASVELNSDGNLLFTSATIGGCGPEGAPNGNEPNSGSTPNYQYPGCGSFIRVTDPSTLFNSIQPIPNPDYPIPGTDGISADPSYQALGVGTDGSLDERLRIANRLRYHLGYPTVDVELTKEQLDLCITRGLEELRLRSGIAYKHGFFFLMLQPQQQKYLLTCKDNGYNRIVTIMGAFRLTSAFLSSAHGAGVYGQIVLQHLYNMGTFDLLSYHIISEYIHLMEILFAARLTYVWDEQKRELFIHNRFQFPELIALECTVERTEQDIMMDRWSKTWIERYALSEARLMLAEIRGKYSSLPGASGSITLNASDLAQRAMDDREKLMQELDDFVSNNPEEYGLGVHMVIG